MLGALLKQGHKQPDFTYIRTIQKQAIKLYMIVEALAAADNLVTLGIDEGR